MNNTMTPTMTVEVTRPVWVTNRPPTRTSRKLAPPAVEPVVLGILFCINRAQSPGRRRRILTLRSCRSTNANGFPDEAVTSTTLVRKEIELQTVRIVDVSLEDLTICQQSRRGT